MSTRSGAARLNSWRRKSEQQIPRRLKRLRKKSEKANPRGLKPARDDKNKRLRRWPKGQHYPKSLFSAACEALDEIRSIPAGLRPALPPRMIQVMTQWTSRHSARRTINKSKLRIHVQQDPDSKPR